MRIETNKGPFRTIEVLLENLSREEILRLAALYSRVMILSHAPLDVPSSFRLKQKQTPNIHLDAPLEQVFSRFRDTVRNEINRTQRMEGFRVVVPDDNRKELYELYRSFEYAQGRAPFSFSAVAPYLAIGAYQDGQLLSGIYFYQSGDALRIFAIFSKRLTDQAMEDKMLYQMIGYATKRLVYELCVYGKGKGARLVDLAAINLADPEKANISKFKSGFGAEIENEYQYYYSKPLFRLFERLAAVRAWMRVRLFGR